MYTYKIVYSIANQPGQKVAFVQANNEISARVQAEKELGGWGVVSIWEVTKV